MKKFKRWFYGLFIDKGIKLMCINCQKWRFEVQYNPICQGCGEGPLCPWCKDQHDYVEDIFDEIKWKVKDVGSR